MVEKREEGREVRVMRGEDGEGSSHCPPVVAVPLLDTAFRSEALERRSLLQEPMMGDRPFLLKVQRKAQFHLYARLSGSLPWYLVQKICTAWYF